MGTHTNPSPVKRRTCTQWTGFYLFQVIFVLGFLLGRMTSPQTQKPNHSVVQTTPMGVRSSSSSSSSSSNSSNCSEEWLGRVARYSNDSFVKEDVLRMKMQHPSCTASRDAVGHLDKMLFVVMCSRDKQNRLAYMHAGWMHWVPKKNLLLLCGQELPGYNVTLLPKLPVDDYIQKRYPNPNGHQASNLRDLKSLWWLAHTKDDFEWVLYVDDDTFVNVPLLVEFVRGVPPHLPVLFSSVLTRVKHTVPGASLTNVTYPQGAAMLFSRTAVNQLGAVLFTPRCPLETPLNDVTIGKCTRAAGVTKTHSIRFCPDPFWGKWSPVFEKTPYGPIDAAMLVTAHYVKSASHAWRFTCLVSARYGWSHPKCTGPIVGCGEACYMPG